MQMLDNDTANDNVCVFVCVYINAGDWIRHNRAPATEGSYLESLESLNFFIYIYQLCYSIAFD